MAETTIIHPLVSPGDGPTDAASMEIMTPQTDPDRTVQDVLDSLVWDNDASSEQTPDLAAEDTGERSPLTTEERRELENCESKIAKGQNTFIELGLNLSVINVARLYRQNYATFEVYLRERWDLGRGYAYQIMDAAQITEQLAGITDAVPTNEYQARALAGLAPEQVSAVWLEAVARAQQKGRPVTALLVKQVRAEVVPVESLVPPTTESPTIAEGDLPSQYLSGRWADLIPTLSHQPRLILIPHLPGNTPKNEAEALTALLEPLAEQTDHQVLVFTKFDDCRLHMDAAEANGYELGTVVVWDHESEKAPTKWSFLKNETLILHLRKGRAGLVESTGSVQWCEDELKKAHPNQLPTGLIARLVQSTTREGEMVLVSSGGVATAAIACREMGRGCVEIEENSKVYKLGAQRLEDAFGPEAQDSQTQTDKEDVQ